VTDKAAEAAHATVTWSRPSSAKRQPVAESDLSEPLEVTPRTGRAAAPTGTARGGRAQFHRAGLGSRRGIRPSRVTACYRAPAGGAFERIAESGAVPTYSTTRPSMARPYRYAIAAVGATGKEGPQSAPLEIALP